MSDAVGMIHDLQYYEPADSNALDRTFIEDFAKARDSLFEQIKKQLIFSLIVFVFACSKYLGIKLQVSVAGFGLTDAPGVLEGLLLISNLLACYTLMLQGNVYLIESAIKHAISRSMPEELRVLYMIRYFPHEYFGVYRPFNLPHIIPNGPSRTIARITALIFLALLFVVGACFVVTNFGLLVYFLWLHPQLGRTSYVLLGFILACGACAIFYVILTRFRMPYLDYTINNEFELLKQVDHRRYGARVHEIYREINNNRRQMEDQGFLRKREQNAPAP